MKVVLISVCLVLIFTFSVSGEGTGDRVADELSGVADGISERSDSNVATQMSDGDIDDKGKVLLEFLTAEELLDEIFGEIVNALPNALSLLCLVSGLVIISGVCNSVCTSIDSTGISQGFEFLSAAAVIAGVLTTLYGQVDRIYEYFDGLASLMNGMIPITGIVLAMGGNVTTASVSTATLYGMVRAVEFLCSETVMPVCFVLCIAAVSSALSGGGMLDGFVSGVKKVYGFFIGLVMTVFVFVLGAQTTLACSADTVAARGARLLSSSIIPNVGGAVGDTLRTVGGSVGYIKSVTGVGGIVLIAVLTLPTLISLLLTRTVFLLTSTLSEVLGCKREARLLSELGGIYGFLLGAVAVSAVAFIIALALFVRVAVALD